jgi:hypothetical protein
MANPSRIFWSVLAAVDAVALIWVASKVDWADFESVRVGETPAGWMIVAAVYAMTIAFKLIAAVFVASVAYAIVREFTGNWKPGRITRVFVSLVLAAILGMAAYLALVALRPILAGVDSAFLDRLIAFDRLTKESPVKGETLGAYLAALAVTAYLAEKYFFRWWGHHWLVSVAALAILAWPVWAVYQGESHQREWVGSQQWSPVAGEKMWIEALAACNALGPGWRLPARSELSMYVSTRPEPIAGWKGVAWTLTSSEYGRSAVVVTLAPHQSGMWRSNAMPLRDRSVCEVDASPGRANSPVVSDWFSERRNSMCASTQHSPELYPAGLQLLAKVLGSVVGGPETNLITIQSQAWAVCMKTNDVETSLPMRGRGYPQEKDFRDPVAFLASMRELCQPRAPGSDAVACTAFAGDTPPATIAPAAAISAPAAK